jgi:AraC-like DNA-binding protein
MPGNFTNNFLIIEHSQSTEMNFSTLSHHNLYEIYFLIDGARFFIIDNKMYQLGKNDVILFKPGSLQKSYGDTFYRGISLVFSETCISKYYTSDAKKFLLSCFDRTIINLNEQAKELLLLFIEKARTYPNHLFIYLASILDLISLSIVVTDKKFDLIHPLVQTPIIEYINKNYATIRNLDEIASALYFSKNHLCNTFKKQTSMTISYYINMVRLQNACALLATTSYSITTISNRCGYESTVYFYRVFKKFMHCTPNDFRQKNLVQFR